MKLIGLVTTLFLALAIFFSFSYLIFLNPVFYNFKVSNDNFFAVHNIDRPVISKNIFKYLTGQSRLDSNYFSTVELNHLADLKWLAQFVKYSALFFSLSTALLFYFGVKHNRRIYQAVSKNFIWIALVMPIVSLIVLFNFESFFLAFHKLWFKNNFWQLDPARDVLINIFPPVIFIGLLKIFFIALIVAFFLIALGLWLIFVKTYEKK